jgi:uncharacterized coiled-coil protein SlyX
MTHTFQRTIQAAYVLGLVALSGCAHPTNPTVTSSLADDQDRAKIQALQKRLHDRERTIAIQDHQIEVMSGQLDALKQIDQDTRNQHRPLRRSVIVTP